MKGCHNSAPYPLEFKAVAVRPYRENEKSLKDVADGLDVTTNSLREWVKRSDVAEGARAGLVPDGRAELNRLRREVRILREKREILKVAAIQLRNLRPVVPESLPPESKVYGGRYPQR